MAFLGASLSRVSLFQQIPSCSLTRLSLSHRTLSLKPNHGRFSLSASLSTQDSTPSVVSSEAPKQINRWKPWCLYYTQGKCGRMNDPTHVLTFNHNFSVELEVSSAKFKQTCSQQLDFFLVLDLEGRVEILEFPILLLDAKTMEVVDIFHRFVRPSAMSKQRINEYINGKYGKMGVDRVWYDTAIPFKEVIQQFEGWMTQHQLWGKEELGGRLRRAAFITCGNWDLNTKVPQQCIVSGMMLPPYFTEWINLKDIYLNFYKRRATGMVTMINELQIRQVGSRHLGIDDAINIARVVQYMLSDGAVLQITARRNPEDPKNVEFLFEDRIM